MQKILTEEHNNFQMRVVGDQMRYMKWQWLYDEMKKLWLKCK